MQDDESGVTSNLGFQLLDEDSVGVVLLGAPNSKAISNVRDLELLRLSYHMLFSVEKSSLQEMGLSS